MIKWIILKLIYLYMPGHHLAKDRSPRRVRNEQSGKETQLHNPATDLSSVSDRGAG